MKTTTFIITLMLIFSTSCKNVSNDKIKNDAIRKNNDSVILSNKVVPIQNEKVELTNNKEDFIPEIKINELELADANSIIKSVGDLKNLIVEDEDLPHVNLTDSNKKVKLTLVCFPGSGRNEVFQFIIEYLSNSDKVKNTSYSEFSTESGLRLGITKPEIINIKGKSYTLKTEGDYEILSYRIDDYKNSSFLQKYNLPSYFMEFYLKKGKVAKMQFGFDYP